MKSPDSPQTTFRADSPRKVLGRPALHVVLGLLFAAAFFWPIFAMEKPATTFNFLYLTWFVCLLAMFAVSRGTEPKADDDDDQDNDDGPVDPSAAGPR
jgi:hypothetical protein